MVNEDVQDWFKQQVEHQKFSRICMTGRHNIAIPDSVDLQETTDFDFEIEASELMDMIMVEFETSRAPDQISMVVADAGDESAAGEKLIQRCVERLSSMLDSKYEQSVSLTALELTPSD